MPRRTLFIRPCTDQVAPEGGERLASHLDQGSELRREPAGVDLTKSLIEQVSDPAELADDRVIRSGDGRDLDLSVQG
jgi:hypothetical protein